jgi:hypothetical protein
MVFSLQFEPLTLREVRSLGRSKPPSITVLLPSYVPGSTAKPIAARLKSAVDRVTLALDRLELSHRDLAMLTAPMLSLTHEPIFREGRRNGIALFVDRDGFHCFEAPGEVPETVVVSNHFHIKPLLRTLLEPREFMILELAQGKVRLIEADGDSMRERPLPRGVPESFDQISSPELPDHSRITRAAGGRGKEKASAISFGLASANEDRRMQFFCTLLDRGLSAFLQERGLPLILAGGDRILNAYQKENSYHGTVAGALHGNIEYLSHEEIIERARMLIKADLTRRGKQYLAEMEEFAPGERWSATLEEVLRAAAQGRVWRLFLADGVSCEGDYTSIVGSDSGPLVTLREDLVNAAAAETVAFGGEIYLLPPESISAPAVALFRYSLA